MNALKIRDAVLLVTGANRGIGKAFVQTALELGAKKIYACARKKDSVKTLVLEGAGRVAALELDVTSPAQIENAARQAGDTQILINNAGAAAYSAVIANYDETGAKNEMAVNYFGTLDMARAFAPVLKKNGGGAMVNIVSVAAFLSFPGLQTYCASKGALHLLTLGLRQELASQGTFVCGVYPGPVETDMAAGIEMEKESPAQVALNVFRGLESGEQSIWPDKFAEQLAGDLKSGALTAAF